MTKPLEWDRRLLRSPDQVAWCSEPFVIHPETDAENGPCTLLSGAPYWIMERFQTVAEAKARAEEVISSVPRIHVDQEVAS